jgi:hypothetical protein
MILEDIRQLKTGPRELRRFGLLVGAVFAGLGIFLWARHRPMFPWFLVPGMALIVCGWIIPRALRLVYIPWMSLALALGFVVSHVILTLFFFLVITPVGLLARLLGKDFLRLKLDRQASSYWLPCRKTPESKADYERQF